MYIFPPVTITLTVSEDENREFIFEEREEKNAENKEKSHWYGFNFCSDWTRSIAHCPV